MLRDSLQPLVTVLIVNWNYGQFLTAAIRSVQNQTYRNLRCVIIDNGSSDDSRSKIDAVIAEDSRFERCYLPENIGHLGAILSQADQIKGEFVTFLDSDDMLFSNFVERHVQTHLATSVGVTTNRVIGIASDGTLLSGGGDGRVDLQIDKNAVNGLDQTWLISASRLGWLWWPGSANMYRTSALQLAFAIAPRTPIRDYFGDTHFNSTAHRTAGTALIGEPLSAYRIHGGNDGSQYVSLTRFRGYRPAAAARSVRQRTQMGVDLIDRWEALTQLIPRERFWQTLDAVFRDVDPRTFYQNKDVRSALTYLFPSLFKSQGVVRTIREAMRRDPGLIVASIKRLGR